MQSELMNQGISLMANGMGTVVVFLTVLVVVTTLLSKVVQKLFPEAEVPAPSNNKPSASQANTAMPSAPVMAAIEKAIAQHRQR